MTYLEINRESLKSNTRNLKTLLRPETKFLAVVKSNAYGHGAVEISRAAIEAGADWLGVVSIDEAMELRQNNIDTPILVLGYVGIIDVPKAAENNITIPVISREYAEELSKLEFTKLLKVHLKIDTGLNRLGLDSDELLSVWETLQNENIIIEGIYSHLASVEENELEYAKMQISNFKKATDMLGEKSSDLIKHIAASSATLVLPESHFDMVRCGIGIYGLWPSEEIKKTFGREEFLMPALSYKTKIVQIKKVRKGEKISYGCTYEAEQDITIAILPIGYYEGLDRGLSNIGQVIVNGERCDIVGRVCMNMTIIDISKLKSQNVKVGDVATIIGKDGGEEITADEISAKLGTINYEIVTRLPQHLERKYIN